MRHPHRHNPLFRRSMLGRGRVRPGRAVSLLVMLVGAAFVVIGLTVIVPNAGVFGVLWTLVAAGITAYHAYNVFSRRGLALYEAELDTADDFDTTLRKLAKLRQDGLITDQEFERKRAELLERRW